MTTKKIYACNFCREESLESVGFQGFKWMGTALHGHSASQCENHLCFRCLTEIGKVAMAGDDSSTRKRVLADLD